MVQAWYMDDSSEDQREPHRLDPNEEASLEDLEKLGVKYWWFEPSSFKENPEFQKLKQERGYSYEDQITVSPEHLENYESKIKSFFDEHIHTDEEIRYILEGSGYFDVRDINDRWIRIAMEKGDMIVLPSGIYHRFTLDSSNYIKALRLFVGEPVWTPYSRTSLDSNHPAVQSYKKTFTPQASMA